MEKLEGIVSWFNEKKGYGFIKAKGKDYFLHYGDIQIQGYKTLYQDDEVTFVPENTSRGYKATLVEPLKKITD